MRTTEGRLLAPLILAQSGPVGRSARVRYFCRVAVVSLLLSIVTGQPPSAATHGAQAFDRGVEAFRTGDYRAALQSFLEARKAGLDTPGLRYNIGVTYYRLQSYPEAGREFQALAREPEWAALAHYNLGLTAQRMGHGQQAVEHFERARRTSADPNLRALAGTALERLVGAPSRTDIVVALAGGYDSNVALLPDAGTVQISGKSDFLVEALAAASHRLTGSNARGWYADGGLVLRKYRDLDQFDLIGGRVGLSYTTGWGRLQSRVGGFFDMIYIDGELLERAAVMDLQVRRPRGDGGDLRGRYQLGRIDGGDGFDYLDGWQHRLTVDAGFVPGPALLRVGYQLEYNDREDLRQGAEFSSYSPTRHSLFASVTWLGLGGWRTDARGEYQMSRYHDPHRLNGGAVEITREDARYGAFARVSRRWTGAWRLFVDYSYYRNISNLDIYDYNRHQLLVGTEAVF